MPYYLSEYIGSGTRQDPFRPVGSDQPGWSAIDLRPDPSVVDGGELNAALLHVPLAFSDPQAQFLADDKLEALSNPQKNFLTNRLGVDLSSPTLLRDIIATLLTNPPANGWKPLRPTRLRWEIWLAGERLWEAPRISGGATDNFNRANENPIAAPWDTINNSDHVNITSNAVVSNNGDAFAWYPGAASSADQYSEWGSVVATSGGGGPAVRCSDAAAARNFYSLENGNPSAYVKFVLDGFTSLGSTGGNAADPMRVEVEGSSIRGYHNGVLVPNGAVTDPSLTTGDPGVFIYAGSMDNWEGGDLAAPAIPFRPAMTSRGTSW